MLIVSETYKNYQNVALSNQLTDLARRGDVLGMR
jgi:hypothetical protein